LLGNKKEENKKKKRKFFTRVKCVGKEKVNDEWWVIGIYIVLFLQKKKYIYIAIDI
jgi:hypothetical protein